MNTKQGAEQMQSPITLQTRINAFYQHRERLVNTLEEDLSLKILVTVPHENVRKFFLDCPRVQQHLHRISIRVKMGKNLWFVCFETLNEKKPTSLFG